MHIMLFHWLSYSIPVKKQQTPQRWMEEGGEGCGLFCSPKSLQRSIGLQHCFNMVSNGYNIAPTLQCCVALKIVLSRVTSSLKAPPHFGGYSIYISLIICRLYFKGPDLVIHQPDSALEAMDDWCTKQHGEVYIPQNQKDNLSAHA